ncbi:MAG TPA: PQQ-binding-like beta-propeller repeat protein, partial [Saprospiraceae bacterium]|nr:PQQ-binding-like beta-propeller repeat protein [Saprospiraceae bacterium]
MKRLPHCFAATLLLATQFAFAQRPADWSVELKDNIQQIIFQNLTGVPIVQTEKAFVGIDPAARKTVWTVQRTPEKAISFDMGPEFYNMTGSPFVLIRNSVIDSRSGKVAISKEKDGFKRVEDYEVIPALNSVLVRTTGSNGTLQLYLVGSDNGEVKWKIDVMKPSVITGMNEEPDEEYVDVPLYTTLVSPDKYLIYRYRKNLAVISPEGKLLWNEKADPAEVLLSPDGKKVLALKALVTGIGNSPVSVRHVTKYRGTKIAAYDLKTGKESWKADIKTDQNIRWVDAHPDFLSVVQAKACNIYNYATGEAYWKDDFKGRRVVEIAPNAEGYLITYESGYKTMQVSKSGVALWKKPQVVETDDDEDDSPDEGDQNVYQYAKGKVLINAERARFRPAKGSGLK